MASNNLTVEQSYAFMNSLFNQATGKTSLVSVSSKDFVTVGQAVLKTGYEQTLNAIGVVLDKTIFSVRPYNAKFKGMMVDNIRFGGITRKINYIDSEAEADAAYTTSDGESVDPWVVKKPKVLQMNFYGSNSYQRHVTIYRDQLYTAFQSAEQFGEFIGGIITTMVNNVELDRENECRAALINMITGKFTADSANVKSILREYYLETGVLLNTQQMNNDTYFVPFIKWLYSYINTLCDQMSDYSQMFHMNVSGKAISRHTPANRMKAYMATTVLNKVAANVMSSIFNPERLKAIDFEAVTYWQSIKKPLSVKAKPTYLKVSDGSLIASESDVVIDNLLGVLFDEDAMGVTIKHDETAASPYNPRGRYYNMFYAYNHQFWNDFTENCVVLYANDQEYFLRLGASVSGPYYINNASIVAAASQTYQIYPYLGDTGVSRVSDNITRATQLDNGTFVSVESSDTTVATVVAAADHSSGLHQITVTGVAAGTAVITTKININGVVCVFNNTITVTAANVGAKGDPEVAEVAEAAEVAEVTEVAEDQEKTKATRKKS